MAGPRFPDLQSRPPEFLDGTRVTLDAFQALVPPFEAAFLAQMAAWRLDGTPRTARRFPVYQNCPLPTPEDRLLFILVYLKTSALQVVHRRLFGMGQSKANQWLHVLLPVLLAALRTLGKAPARSLAALAQRLGGRCGHGGHPAGGGARAPSRGTRRRAGVPPCAHDGTEPRIVRPQDPAEQAACESGKQKDHTVEKVLLVHALLTRLFRSETSAGRVHEKRIAEATPVSLPCREPIVVGFGLLGVHAPPGGDPYADEENMRPGADVGAAHSQSGASPPPAAARACPQPCEARSPRHRPDPPVEGGRARSRDGTLWCPAQHPGAPHTLAGDG